MACSEKIIDHYENGSGSAIASSLLVTEADAPAVAEAGSAGEQKTA